MPVPGIFKLFRLSILLLIWHLDLLHSLPIKVGVVETFLVLTNICLMFGGCPHVQRVVLLNKCLAADKLQ